MCVRSTKCEPGKDRPEAKKIFEAMMVEGEAERGDKP